MINQPIDNASVSSQPVPQVQITREEAPLIIAEPPKATKKGEYICAAGIVAAVTVPPSVAGCVAGKAMAMTVFSIVGTVFVGCAACCLVVSGSLGAGVGSQSSSQSYGSI